ncbi:exocyst complex component EXO70H1-like [Tripterygium wilfordii]|uniref:exocyst complex component EXO70H1-like n=1 Tax=Tripterygium wilfordii TaxID=458696 RepID=UPI0018F83E78|nr:exocyst complex component EXO70H1-like [Tripterygium wilfordii]
MPMKGMRSMFFKSTSPFNSPARSPLRFNSPALSPARLTFSETLVDENIENAQTLINKWESDASSYADHTSLFSMNRQESRQYLDSVKNIQSAMKYIVTENSNSEKLVRAQNLMQIGMKRLEKEFYYILKNNREYLDPESVSTRSSLTPRSSLSEFDDDSEDEFKFATNSVSEDVAGDSVSEFDQVSMAAATDLKAIANCMISSGYGMECVKIYKIVRKSIVDEAMYHLGVEILTFSQLQKMDWEVVEIKIKTWLNAVKFAVKTIFTGERILCDQVFSASPSVAESVFMDISREGAMALFVFPEHVAKCKKSPEKMFRTLDLYEAIADVWPEIESIFAFESTSAIRSQAVNSLVKLGEAVRMMLTDFEAAIQKDNSRKPVPSGGVHPLTRYVMNYLTFLTDYSGILTDILADWPLTVQSPLPEAYFGSPVADDNISSPISMRLSWLVLVLLCKLDGKAELYKDVALSYLFLANNLQYVVVKVRTSNLKFLLGDEWIGKHEAKVKQYGANYERMGWSKVLASLPENPTADISLPQVKDHFRRFNFAFEETYKKQSSWVVPDSKLRDEIKVSVAKKLVPAYREFYAKYRTVVRKEIGKEALVRFAPDDLGNYLSDLFYGTGGPGSVSSNSSTSSFSSKGGH